MKPYLGSPLQLTVVLSLCTVGIIPASLSESLFSDDILAQGDGELGIIDISQSGRTDVKTNLRLSPWEMFVLNDIVFKVTAKQCPKLNGDLLTSFKEMLSDSFKQALMVQVQNNDFLPSYSHLVRCLDHLYEKSGNKEEKNGNAKTQKLIQLKEKEELEAASVEKDWIAENALIPTTTTTTEAPISTKIAKEEAVASTWLWGFKSIHQWLKNMFKERPKPLTPEEKQDKEIIDKRELEKTNEHQRRIDIAYRRARQNFANVYHEMSKIVRKSCPVIHRPDKIFMRMALMDMATWATLEERTTISTAAKYFRKHEVLKILQECHNAI